MQTGRSDGKPSEIRQEGMQTGSSDGKTPEIRQEGMQIGSSDGKTPEIRQEGMQTGSSDGKTPEIRQEAVPTKERLRPQTSGRPWPLEREGPTSSESLRGTPLSPLGVQGDSSSLC
jgi:hypothetical protein